MRAAALMALMLLLVLAHVACASGDHSGGGESCGPEACDYCYSQGGCESEDKKTKDSCVWNSSDGTCSDKDHGRDDNSGAWCDGACGCIFPWKGSGNGRAGAGTVLPQQIHECSAHPARLLWPPAALCALRESFRWRQVLQLRLRQVHGSDGVQQQREGVHVDDERVHCQRRQWQPRRLRLAPLFEWRRRRRWR